MQHQAWAPCLCKLGLFWWAVQHAERGRLMRGVSSDFVVLNPPLPAPTGKWWVQTPACAPQTQGPVTPTLHRGHPEAVAGATPSRPDSGGPAPGIPPQFGAATASAATWLNEDADPRNEQSGRPGVGGASAQPEQFGQAAPSAGQDSATITALLASIARCLESIEGRLKKLECQADETDTGHWGYRCQRQSGWEWEGPPSWEEWGRPSWQEWGRRRW